jgi:hypothetical protein
MTLLEALETTRVHRVAGPTTECVALVTLRPLLPECKRREWHVSQHCQ